MVLAPASWCWGEGHDNQQRGGRWNGGVWGDKHVMELGGLIVMRIGAERIRAEQNRAERIWKGEERTGDERSRAERRGAERGGVERSLAKLSGVEWSGE